MVCNISTCMPNVSSFDNSTPARRFRLPTCIRRVSTAFRLVLFGGVVATSTLFSASATPPAGPPGAATKPVIVLVHGSWAGGWQFKKMQPLLEARGYEVWRPTLTGLGERSHLAHRDIGLETHITDIVNLLRFERLRDVILVGHSYGGMVVTGVVDRMPDRIKHVVYLDALVPSDGDSVASLFASRMDPKQLEKMVKDGLIIPPWVRADTPLPHDTPHPLKTYTDPIVLKNAASKKVPATYILTVEKGKAAENDDFFGQAERAKARAWNVLRLEADHNPQQSVPGAVVELLAGIK
jgi:pimeloyl-ACP methyl ester carboxylesterase